MISVNIELNCQLFKMSNFYSFKLALVAVMTDSNVMSGPNLESNRIILNEWYFDEIGLGHIKGKVHCWL